MTTLEKALSELLSALSYKSAAITQRDFVVPARPLSPSATDAVLARGRS